MSERRGGEGFLGRWSRLKTGVREAEAQPPAQPVAAAEASQAQEAPPELPPVESLTIDSDFRGFFHPEVDEDLRRSALRKLFSDPHFNVMDGLDVYIDDYSVSEPLTPEMVAGLKQAQRILRWAEGQDDEPEADEERVESDAEAEASAAEEPPPAIAAAPGVAAAERAADTIPQEVAKPD